MPELLTYSFFRNAMIGVLIISIAAAIIGTYIVTRRLVSISGGVTHACFGGLGLGYYLGLSPVACAAVFAVFASLGVEWMSTRHRMREDSAIAVIWALGMALGVFFVFATPGYVPELNSFLFGNVLTITTADLWIFAAFTAVLAAFVAVFYRFVVACAFDRDFARVIHLPVRFITLSMTVLTAICIVLTIKLVGVMLLMSMLAMPQIISEVFCRRFHTLMFCSIAVSVVCCLTGLLLSAVIDVPCSALIVMVMVMAYLIARIAKWLSLRLSRSRLSAAAMTVGVVVAACGLLTGCSLKKNTAASRNYTAFITRYNIHYNGDEHFRETLKEMENAYADDYSRTLLMHPAEAFADEKATQPSGDFKRSIEKAQKAIQLRSIKKRPARKAGKSSDPEYKKWMQREEYNPFLHNSWLMMARSQYYGGDFLGAASTFYYISRHFWWLPEVVTESKLWQARCYCAIDWLFEAESILSKIKPAEIEGHSSLEDLYYFSYADLYVRSRDYEKAIPMLEKAIRYAKGAQKTRLTFLLGQMYASTGNRQKAYEAFRKVGNTSGASYRTRFNARIKQSEVFQGTDIRPEVKALEAMTRYGANKEYLDQIYYAIGNLYMSRADTAQAIKNYELAAKKSVRNGIDKGLAQLALGRIYYEQREYDKAQPCLAEAVSQLPETYPDYRQLKRQSDVLDELAVYSQNVTLQDSLLRLSHLTPEEQRAVADRLVNELKERERIEAEELAREQYLADQAANGNGLQQGNASSAPATFALNTDKSWYFYNEATRNAGRTEFQKRWGSRRLEDDWRRRNKASYSFGLDDEEAASGSDSGDSEDGEASTDGEGGEAAADREAREHASDPHYPEYYLRQIPTNDQERATANDIIQEGLYNMGVILKDKLDDTSGARYQFDRLMRDYPDNVYRLDAYFNMYLMYARSGNMAEANRYRDLIIAEFPESRQALALTDPDYIENLRRMPQEEQRLYDQAYEAYFNNDNRRVHELYQKMVREFPMSRVMPKMMFLEALSYVASKDADKFNETLNKLIAQYPEADVSPLASSYLKLLADGRELSASGGNVRGIVWSTRLGNDSIRGVSLDTPAQFDFESDGSQLLVLIYRADLVNANQLLFDVARHNFTTYNVRDYDLEPMRFGNIGLLVISGFNNRREVADYRSQLEKGGLFRLPKGVVPLNISDQNFKILLNEGRSLEEYFDAVGDKRLDQIHTAVVGPADSEEAPATPTSPATPTVHPSVQPADQPTVQPEAPVPAESPTAPVTPEIPATPVAPSQPMPAPQPQPEPEPEPEPEPFDYDIPIPMLPTGKPPVPGH